jgi:hypothetical protein
MVRPIGASYAWQVVVATRISIWIDNLHRYCSTDLVAQSYCIPSETRRCRSLGERKGKKLLCLSLHYWLRYCYYYPPLATLLRLWLLLYLYSYSYCSLAILILSVSSISSNDISSMAMSSMFLQSYFDTIRW